MAQKDLNVDSSKLLKTMVTDEFLLRENSEYIIYTSDRAEYLVLNSNTVDAKMLFFFLFLSNGPNHMLKVVRLV